MQYWNVLRSHGLEYCIFIKRMALVRSCARAVDSNVQAWVHVVEQKPIREGWGWGRLRSALNLFFDSIEIQLPGDVNVSWLCSLHSWVWLSKCTLSAAVEWQWVSTRYSSISWTRCELFASTTRQIPPDFQYCLSPGPAHWMRRTITGFDCTWMVIIFPLTKTNDSKAPLRGVARSYVKDACLSTDQISLWSTVSLSPIHLTATMVVNRMSLCYDHSSRQYINVHVVDCGRPLWCHRNESQQQTSIRCI
jgi:hypothetical protein